MITKNINNIAESLSKNLRTQGKYGLNLALDFIRPYFLSLGLRVAKLNSTQVEIVIPYKIKNLSGLNGIHEGVLVSTLIEGVHTLWNRNRPEGNFKVLVMGLGFSFLKPLQSDLRLRIEMNEVSRENSLAQLQIAQQAEQEIIGKFYNQDEILVAEGQIQLKLTNTPEIEWK